MVVGPAAAVPASSRRARPSRIRQEEVRTHVGHVPQRTCIGCREVVGQDRLVRLSLVAGEQEPVVVPDPARRLGGRGAWLHPSRECADRALRRRAFNRAFRRSVPIQDEALLIEQILQGDRDGSTSTTAAVRTAAGR
ncbi:YlxR family protein [Kocuria palustris]|uniref:YlxR family protein n=1 Tax=Kocuria palustris TaxID=71999 RepID=UPI0028D045B2|nr:YlxR family protein [Kocuria palustris]